MSRILSANGQPVIDKLQAAIRHMFGIGRTQPIQYMPTLLVEQVATLHNAQDGMIILAYRAGPIVASIAMDATKSQPLLEAIQAAINGAQGINPELDEEQQ